MEQHFKFIDPDRECSLTITGGGECRIRAFIVGGGGVMDMGQEVRSGAGSGYLKYVNMSIEIQGDVRVSLMVGGPGKASTLSINGSRFTAGQGQSNHRGSDDTLDHGGDGFSGGGCTCQGFDCSKKRLSSVLTGIFSNSQSERLV